MCKLPPHIHLLLDLQPHLTLFTLGSVPFVGCKHDRIADSVRGSGQGGIEEDHDVDDGNDVLVFRQVVQALRSAHGTHDDDGIDVSTILHPRDTPNSPTETFSINFIATSANSANVSEWCAPLTMGDSLFSIPRLLDLLNRKGVSLVECSAEFPHLIVDFETALLAFEVHSDDYSHLLFSFDLS